ncbi:hypothetical protein [Haloplasma contractile]|uniref:Membrane lipoprotein n=1 Tax=Haloplasma contractile SSD-17B TaxID=1033810 RepID=F7PW75_9MOLU|nr:hypothetical protein [Haloplasma contractile]ERJ11265.1 membrane lipoprotein [Haloplasma contractile SSD-17B]
MKHYIMFVAILAVLLTGCNTEPPLGPTAFITDVKTEQNVLSFTTKIIDEAEVIDYATITITDSIGNEVFSQLTKSRATDYIIFDELVTEEMYTIEVKATYGDQVDEILGNYRLTTSTWLEGGQGEIYDINFSGNTVTVDVTTTFEHSSNYITLELHQDGRLISEILSREINSPSETFRNQKIEGLIAGESYKLVLNYIDTTTGEFTLLDSYDFTMEEYASPTGSLNNHELHTNTLVFDAMIADPDDVLDDAIIEIYSDHLVITSIGLTDGLVKNGINEDAFFTALNPNETYTVKLFGYYMNGVDVYEQVLMDEFTITTEDFLVTGAIVLPVLSGNRITFDTRMSDPYNMITGLSVLLVSDNTIIAELTPQHGLVTNGVNQGVYFSDLPTGATYQIKIIANYFDGATTHDYVILDEYEFRN